MPDAAPPDLPGTSIAEWILAGLAALLLAGFFAVTLAAGLGEPDEPPDLSARVTSIRAGAGGFTVRLRVENGAGQAAATVGVVATVAVADGPPIERRITFDYVPGQSSREGGILFPADPRGRLTVAVEGYVDP